MLIQSTSNGNYLTFDDEKHTYVLNGTIVPSVTTVNKSSNPESFKLTGWKIKEGAKFVISQLKEVPILVKDYPEYYIKEILTKSASAWSKEAKKAANIGTLVHDYAEQFEFKGKINEELHNWIMQNKDRSKVFSCIKKFRRWKVKNHDEIIMHEEIVGSIEHGFAGKFDRLANRKGSIVLSDFKTSSGIFPDQFVQLAAYTILLKEWYNIEVDEIEIIRFGKEDGEFETKLIKNKDRLKELQEQFLRNVKTAKFYKAWEEL